MRPRSRAGIAYLARRKRISLTVEEHRELACEIDVAARRLRALCDLVVGVYGPANRAAFSFLKAMEAMGRLEQDLATPALHDGHDGPAPSTNGP